MLRKNANIYSTVNTEKFFTENKERSPLPKSRFTSNNQTNNKSLTPNKHIKDLTINQKIQTNRTNATQRFDRITSKTNQILQKEKAYRLNTNTSVNINEYNAVKVKKDSPNNQSYRMETTQSGFQASRQQIKKCIQGLSIKISSELKFIESAIAELTVSIESIFYKKLNQLRQQMTETIQSIFNEAKNQLSTNIRVNNETLLQKMLQYRFALGEHDKKIKEFRVKIQDSNWKKVAGEVFVQNYDEVVDKIIGQSTECRNTIPSKRLSQDTLPLVGQYWQDLKKMINMIIQKKCS